MAKRRVVFPYFLFGFNAATDGGVGESAVATPQQACLLNLTADVSTAMQGMFRSSTSCGWPPVTEK